MSDTMLGRAFNTARNIAEDAMERVEKRWDQAMDVIHARPIRNPTHDALGGGEQFAAQARERLDYQLRHPGPGEIAERHADLSGDATVDRSQIDKVIRQEVEQARNPVFDRWTTGADYEKALEAQQAQPKFVRERTQAAEQGWKPNEHPEDPHYHERFGNREPSLSWEVVGGRQILPFVDGKENGTMDSEVKAAKQHVREREQERWDRVEQIGRQAINSDRARIAEKEGVTTEADMAKKAERQRPQSA